MNLKHLLLLTLLVVTIPLTACTGRGSSEPPATSEPPRQETTATTAAPPTIAPTRAAAPSSDGVYRVDQSASSSRSALENVELVLYRATLTDDSLILRVGFHNISEKSFYLAGGVGADTFRLVDAAGTEYEPVAYSENLDNIDPPGGFIAGQANVGDLTFPRPAGPAPFELRYPSYDLIRFTLDQVIAAEALRVPEQTYPLGIELFSSRSALAPVLLRLEALTVTSDELIFDVAFVNTRRQPYDISRGLSGEDARLLDAEFAAYQPSSVSDSLRATIAPERGWLPGQAHTGQLTFPRPQHMEQLRFIFPEYTAATLQFGPSGLVNTSITSAAGAAPLSTPTPEPQEAVLRELDTLLERQARAVEQGDLSAYLATFTEPLQQEQRAIFERSRNLPLSGYQVEASPSTVVLSSDIAAGSIKNVTVTMRYRLRGAPEDNPLQHILTYGFERRNDNWLVSAYTPERQPPFWWTGDVIVRETPHFLIIARTEATGELDIVARECEQAYTELQAAGLTLTPRIVAYFATTQDDFETQTGQGSRTLGVAMSLYDLSSEEIQVLGRIFYLNGEAFQEETESAGPFGRQATIRHELVHLALAPETRPFTPPWLVEGAAMFYAGQNTPEFRDQLVTGGRLDSVSLARLTRADTLGEFDILGQSVGPEYVFSAEVTRYLIETYGQERYGELYRFFSRIPADQVRDRMPVFSGPFGSAFGNLSEELTTQALSEVYGLTIEELDAAVKQWLRGS